VPDYYQIVKKPVDLATMEGRCISDLYSTPQKFVDEFALMINNAVLYNTVRMSSLPLFSTFFVVLTRFTTAGTIVYAVGSSFCSNSAVC